MFSRPNVLAPSISQKNERFMTTYIYETIQTSESEELTYYEIEQDDDDAPLTRHPEVGIAIRRVIVDGAPLTKREDCCAGDDDSCCGSSGCC